MSHVDIARRRSHDLVRAAGGVDLAERLRHLDKVVGERRVPWPAPQPPDVDAPVDFDVLVAGGGLWSLLAPVLAARGLRVAVLDRAKAAQAHREWNASGPELEALVHAGLLTRESLEALVLARYEQGICRFAEGGCYPVVGVLDHAVDARGLLGRGRALAEARGVTVLDGHSVLSHASGKAAVRAMVRAPHGTMELVARFLVDARGASSPYASADLVCPTVGGVLGGLAEGSGPDEMNSRIGEILVTTEGIESGRQHVWEAFPGRPGETTVYLFHYARASERLSLTDLYARFFEKLPSYKRGDAHLLRPTFGFIPGWSRLSAPPRAPDARVVLVGDAAARHSPLTYCGFGAMLRSLVPAADAIERAVYDEPVDLECIMHDAPTHALTGALASIIAAGTCRGDETNLLLDAAFKTIHAMGHGSYARLLRDELRAAEFVDFVRKTARRHPAAWRHVIRALGPMAAGRWALGLAWASAKEDHAVRRTA